MFLPKASFALGGLGAYLGSKALKNQFEDQYKKDYHIHDWVGSAQALSSQMGYPRGEAGIHGEIIYWKR